MNRFVINEYDADDEGISGELVWKDCGRIASPREDVVVKKVQEEGNIQRLIFDELRPTSRKCAQEAVRGSF